MERLWFFIFWWGYYPPPPPGGGGGSLPLNAVPDAREEKKEGEKKSMCFSGLDVAYPICVGLSGSIIAWREVYFQYMFQSIFFFFSLHQKCILIDIFGCIFKYILVIFFLYFMHIYCSKTKQQKYIFKVFFIIFVIYFSEYVLYMLKLKCVFSSKY